MLGIIAAVAALVALPTAAVRFPREIARWYRAAALESSLDQDHVRAIRHLDRAIHWSPSEPELYLLRADFRNEVGAWQDALEDSNRARELDPTLAAVGPLRSQLLLHLGRYEEAVAERQAALHDADDAPGLRRARLLNELAYTRAVGNLELPQALENAEESLALLGDSLPLLDPAGMLAFARGFNLVGRGEAARAPASLDEAVRGAESLLQRRISQIQSLAADPRGAHAYQDDLETLHVHLGGILRLRAEVLDQLGRTDEAKQDHLRIEAMARDGNVSFARPYDIDVAIDRVADVGNAIDTRGFLFFRLGDLAAARRDLDRAVAAGQAICRAMPWLVDALKHSVTDLRPLQQQARLAQFSLAVITYHRMLVLEALGMSDAAAADRATIVQLGFEPGEHLF